MYTFLSHTATAFGMLLDLDASTPTYKIFCLGEINGSATSHNYNSETNRFEPLNVTGPAKYQLSFTPDSSKVLVPFCIGYYTAKYNHFNAGQDATFGGVISPSSTYTDSVSYTHLTLPTSDLV